MNMLGLQRAVPTYWRQFASERAANKQLPVLTQVVINEPTCIVEVRRIDAQNYFLAEFDGIDAPVLIPCQTLSNHCPQMVIDFFEAQQPGLS
jgi:hypothetical protein